MKQEKMFKKSLVFTLLSVVCGLFLLSSDARAELLFVGDAETGDASQWCGVHSAVPVLPPVTSPVRDGQYAFKSEVRDGALIYGTERSEYANGPTLCGNHTYQQGEENYTAVSVYPEPNFPYYSHWSLVTQFKGPHTGTPPMQISLKEDKWEIVGSGRISPRPRWYIGDIQRGTWNDFVVHAYWHPDENTGWFEVYFQGELVIPKTFASTMYLDDGYPTPLFLSVGQYRDTGPASGTAILYVDAVKVGTSLAEVAPGGSIEIPGDLNGDDAVTLADLILQIRMLTGLVPPDLAKADLDGNGALTLGDARALVRLLMP